MTSAWVEERRCESPVARLCSAHGVSRSGYYAWRSRRSSAAETRRETLTEKVALARPLDLYADSAGRSAKPGTRTNHRTITNELNGFFTPNADPKRLTEADAKGFLEHLRKRGLASYTVARRVRRVRSIFAFAVKENLAPANPFAGLKSSATLPDDRKAYVSPVIASRLISAACPVWRTIVALCRFGGLRCPSEVFRLTWADVDLAAGRMAVPNVKTAGQTGKAYRVCPVFGQLRPYLEDAYDLVEPGSVYVVGGATADHVRARMDGPNGSNDSNTRTAMLKLVKRAGLTPWPRLFHTLRASCETDLLDTLPMSAVTEWLGHSAAIALKHYARVPEHVFKRATQGDAKCDARATQNATHSGAGTSEQETTKPPQPLDIEGLRRLVAGTSRSCPLELMTLRGFEPRSHP